MGALLAGAVVLVLILISLRGVVSVDPKALAKALGIVGGIALAFLALWLLAERRVLPAVAVAAFAWFVYQGGRFWRVGWLVRKRAETPSQSDMTRDQAFKILGLRRGATADDIHAAHHRLMQQYHPDHGGSDFLAAKINEAKDVLLGI